MRCLNASGATFIPDVLANGDADTDASNTKHRALTSLPEVAVFIKHAIVREEYLVVHMRDTSIADDSSGVVYVGVTINEADYDYRPVCLVRYLVEAREVLRYETGSEEKILRRIATDGKLREDNNIGPLAGGLVDR